MAKQRIRTASVALMALLVALLASISIGVPSAAAEPATEADAAPGMSTLAGQPHIEAEGGGRVVHKDFFFTEPDAGARARAWVHSGTDCRDSFCTIQRFNGDRYRAYKMTGCDIYDLDTL